MDENQNTIKLPNEIYEKALKEIIEENLKGSADKYELIFSAGSSKGDNYIGIIYRIQVVEKEKNEIKLNLIVKLPPQSITRRIEMQTNVFFTREADFYDNLYPIYKKFQEERGIDVEKEGFHQIPVCYKTLIEEPNEGLFFEDLKASGFEMFDRFKEVTKEHAFLVMKALAKMHAVFYAIKDQNPTIVESYFELQDSFTMLCERENSSLNTWFETLKVQTLEVVEKSNNADMIGRIKDLLKNDIGNLLKSCFNLEKTEPHAVICHGDCWNNNMLFKNSKNGIPKDLRFLDFQILRYASPVCDLMYYIFCCTTKSLRDKHYREFLGVYYNELTMYIKRLESNPDKLYPREAFEHHLKEFGKFGFIMAMMVLPIFTSDVNDVPDMDDFAENLKKIGQSEDVDKKNAFNFTTEKTYDKYAERMMGVCEDMLSLGYI